jgi:twinfilin-like protein
MVYASGANGVYQTAKILLEGSTSVLATRKLETSDPREIDEAYLRMALGYGSSKAAGSTVSPPLEKKPFARPKGPGRKR